jgi:hypothetical protein
MPKPRIRFTRSETWASGWRGKQSSVGIIVDGRTVGKITGTENPLGQMEYDVGFIGRPAPGTGCFYTQRGAKNAADNLAAGMRFFVYEHNRAGRPAFTVYDSRALRDYADHPTMEAAVEHARELQEQSDAEDRA